MRDQTLTEPVVHPKPWDTIPHRQIVETILAADQVEDRAGDQEAKVREQNQVLVSLLVQRRARHKVVDASEEAILSRLAVLVEALAFGLSGMVVVSSHIGKEVQWPATQLARNDVACSVERSLLEELVHLVQQPPGPCSVLLARAWHKDHVAGHVAGGLVVLGVRDLPREVRDEKSRVTNPADGVVQRLAWRERLVAALVREDPETGAEQTLQEGVHSPESESRWVGWHVFWRAELVEESESSCEEDNVAHNVRQTADCRPLEAVLRYGISYLLDGVIW